VAEPCAKGPTHPGTKSAMLFICYLKTKNGVAMNIKFCKRNKKVLNADETKPVKFVPIGNNVWQVVYAEQ
jgi:hypothetical protein